MAVDLYRRMWFGTKERMSAIRAPKIDYAAPSVGWDGGVTQLLNGGAYVRRSTTSHRTYSMAWPNMSRDEVRLIMDYADGVYGDGPIYFIDPFAMDKNLLPQHWATPRLVFNDGPVLTGAPRETVLNTGALMSNDLGYPARGPAYVDPGSTAYPMSQRPRLYVPVPDGYTAWFGVHGIAYNAAAIVQVTTSNGVVTTPPLLSVSDTNRFSNSFEGTGSMTGIEISLTRAGGGSVLSGMMLQVLPTGVVPTSGGFISGQGNSGVRFATNPSLQQYSAAMDMVGLSVQLVEDEAWR